MILGRKQALIMEYVNFPEIQKPAVQAKTDRSIKKLMEEPAKNQWWSSNSKSSEMHWSSGTGDPKEH